MDLNKLSEDQKKAIHQCINALIYGPFIPKKLIHTLTGIDPSEYVSFLNRWNYHKEIKEEHKKYIYQALLQLLWYPHNRFDVWSDYISYPKESIEKVFLNFEGVEKQKPKAWNGIIQGYFTPKAQLLWDNIPNEIQQSILTNVWCQNCDKTTIITNYEGGLDELGRLSIYGKCAKCFKNIETIYEIRDGQTGSKQE